ncbi:MAG: transposase, partial [Alphaproteobacteria bacterium]
MVAKLVIASTKPPGGRKALEALHTSNTASHAAMILFQPVWRQAHQGRVSATSDLTVVIRYALRHWPGLTLFLDDGWVEMDTNVVERAIRPVAINRKNVLSARSDGGARHRAIAMTLIQTAKLNGVEPMTWLTDVLERIVSGRTKATELD